MFNSNTHFDTKCDLMKACFQVGDLIGEPASRLHFLIIFLLLFSSAIVLPLVGCKRSSITADGIEVSGRVLLPNQQPLGGGILILRPEEGVFGATAEIQSDGTCTLKDSLGQPNVVPGKYQVFVRFGQAAPESLRKSVNQRYQESSEDVDSDVVIDISDSGQELVIQLKR